MISIEPVRAFRMPKSLGVISPVRRIDVNPFAGHSYWRSPNVVPRARVPVLVDIAGRGESGGRNRHPLWRCAAEVKRVSAVEPSVGTSDHWSPVAADASLGGSTTALAIRPTSAQALAHHVPVTCNRLSPGYRTRPSLSRACPLQHP